MGKIVPIQGDNSHLQAKISESKTLIREVYQESTDTKENILLVARLGSQLLNAVLSNVKKTGAIQAIMAAQQITFASINLAQLEIKAVEAFTSGDMIRGSIYQALTTIQLMNLHASIMAQIGAKQAQVRMDRIQELRLSYS